MAAASDGRATGAQRYEMEEGTRHDASGLVPWQGRCCERRETKLEMSEKEERRGKFAMLRIRSEAATATAGKPCCMRASNGPRFTGFGLARGT